MWYKKSQNGFGGGMLNAVEQRIQQALAPDAVEEEPVIKTPLNPIDEPTSAYEKRLWDTIVNKSDGMSNNFLQPNSTNSIQNGQAVESNEARRLSPYHKNPEETTMEEQLEAVRQENVNNDPSQSMSSTEETRGELLVRGEFPYASGKGWTGYEDLPSNKSWA